MKEFDWERQVFWKIHEVRACLIIQDSLEEAQLQDVTVDLFYLNLECNYLWLIPFRRLIQLEKKFTMEIYNIPLGVFAFEGISPDLQDFLYVPDISP